MFSTRHGALGDDRLMGYGLGDPLTDWIQDRLNAMANALFDKIKGRLDDKIAELRAQVLAAVQGAIDKITNYVKTAMDSITVLAKKIQATIEETMDQIRSSMDKFAAAAVTALSSLESTLKKGVADMQSQLTALSTKLITDMRTEMSKFAVTLKTEIVDKMSSQFKDLQGKMTSQFTDVSNKLKTDLNLVVKTQLEQATKDLQARVMDTVKTEIARIPQVTSQTTVDMLKQQGLVVQGAGGGGGGWKFPSFGDTAPIDPQGVLDRVSKHLQWRGFLGMPLSAGDANLIAEGLTGISSVREVAVVDAIEDDRLI